MMQITDEEKLKQLEEKLAKYKPMYDEKKKMFRGVKHEDSLSELRYTEFKVYQDIVDGLVREIAQIKAKLR
jgi:hypothetical protein